MLMPFCVIAGRIGPMTKSGSDPVRTGGRPAGRSYAAVDGSGGAGIRTARPSCFPRAALGISHQT
jgi:hypothetical protein